MDRLDRDRQIIKTVLRPYAHIKYAYDDIQNKTVFDPESDQYLIISTGWSQEKHRIHGCLIHIEIMDNKVWIQRDGTENGIASELIEAGIPQDRIVLGFKHPEIRPYTGFAIA
jgi:XisI protein